MWQFAEAVRGLADGCRELGLPVTGGNVSLYNQTGDVADPPDPGRRRPRCERRRPPPRARRLADARRRRCCLLGDDAAGVRRLGLGEVVHGHLGGLPPARGPGGASELLGEPDRRLGRDGLVGSAHDLSDGGLAQALTESALRYGIGARLRPRRGRVHRAVQRVGRPRRWSPRPTRTRVRTTAEAGRRPGHRAGDDGRRRAGRRRPARPAARRAARRLDRDPARRSSAAPEHRGRRRPGGDRPDQLMAGTAPIPADDLRAAVEPVRAWLDGEGEQPPRAVVGAAVKTSARWLAQQVPGRSVELRVPPHVAVQCIAGAAAHARHPAERGRDRRRHLAAAGHRRRSTGPTPSPRGRSPPAATAPTSRAPPPAAAETGPPPATRGADGAR